MSDLIVAPIDSGTQRLPKLSGRYIVPCSIGCSYPPQVEAVDLLDVDFDQKSLRSDGLYLVESIEGTWGHPWRGCRRFQIKGSGWWMDLSGEKEWQQVGSPEAIGLRVVGHVREVYKPSR